MRNGSHVIQSLVQLRIVKQFRQGKSPGSIFRSKVLGIDAIFGDAQEKGSFDPMNKQNKIYFEGCVDRWEKDEDDRQRDIPMNEGLGVEEIHSGMLEITQSEVNSYSSKAAPWVSFGSENYQRT